MSGDPRAVLMRDIFDDPDDDLPRLVLGDWLADQGDPRGEFIQIDVRLHAGVKDRDERERLNDRRRHLLARNALTWLGSLVDVASSWEFHRGFVWLLIRSARLVTPEGRSALLSPEFGWVERVKVIDCSVPGLRDAGLFSMLATVPALDLANSRLGNEGVRQLLTALEWDGLRHLDLSLNAIGAQGVTRLAAAPQLARLRSLVLGGNNIGEAGALALMESPHLTSLRTIDLRGCTLLSETKDELRHRFGDRVRLNRR